MSFEPRPLGRAGLRVGPIGIGSSYGVGDRDIERAVDHGLNLLFWASLRRGAMRRAVRRMGSRDRGRLVLAAATFARWPFLIRRRAESAVRALGTDALDLFFLAWHQRPPSDAAVEEILRLAKRGVIRATGLSTHTRPLAGREVADPSSPFDVVMVRYNAAHRGAEEEVFPRTRPGGPGILAFTATRWGKLVRRGLPARDCYRFCLSHPAVDACLAGPRNARELEAALQAATAGPMGDDELARARELGDRVYGRRRANAARDVASPTD